MPFTHGLTSDLKLVMLLVFQATVSETLNLEKCAEYGYSTNLMCSSCDELAKFNLMSLSESCLQCCREDRDHGDAIQKFPYAELVVCG